MFKYLGSVFVFFNVAICFISKAGEEDKLLEINKKMAEKVFCFFYLTILFLLCNIFIFLKSVIFDNNLFGTVSTQFGLNITQICLAEDCSEDQVRYQ